MASDIFVYLLVERGKALSAAHRALYITADSASKSSREHVFARSTNKKRIFAKLYFVRSFFDDLFLQRFILRAVFLTIYFCSGIFSAVFSYCKNK